MLIYLWPRNRRTSMINYTSLLSRFADIFELIPYLALYNAHLPQAYTSQYLMEDAGLSLSPGQKNFFDYLYSYQGS
jgi:hypothetical protein